MPKDKEMTNHPCHLLSLPSAKRFWCRHCMSVFEDAITRWRHSRSCRYGVVNNFMKRRELEAKALQNTTVLNPVEARVEQSIQMADLAIGTRTVQVKDENGVEILTTPEDFTCFICHKKFQSMDEMRHHVKFPCNASKIVTTKVPHPKHSMPVFIESVPPRHSWDQTQGIEIQQPVTSYVHEQSYQTHGLEQHLQAGGSVEVRMQDSGFEQSYTEASVSYDATGRAGTSSAPADQEDQKNLTPTTIYVNEKGETVIEVENLDLSSDGGELSLAHLLTQLSQQGIVFDKSRSSSLQAQDFVLETRSEQDPGQVYEVEAQEHAQQDPHAQNEIMDKNETFAMASNQEGDEEEGQPTAEDAANTLAQLAGFRGYIQKQQQETVPESIAQQAQERQTVELIQLSNNGPADSAVTSLPEAQSVQAYQYASPVTIQYTYPSSNPMAVVSSQVQQQDQTASHHIVGAQHMTLQEVLTSDSAPHLYIQTEPGAAEGEQTDIKHDSLDSVRYVVDPVTGHQVMQQVNAEDFNQENDLAQEQYASTKQPDGVVQVSTQETSIAQHPSISVPENTTAHSLIITTEPETSEAIMEMDTSAAASEELTRVIVTSAEEAAGHMETDYDPAQHQVESNYAFAHNSRPEDNFQVQIQTVPSQSTNDISQTEPPSTASDVPSSMAVSQSVSVRTTCTAVETQSASSATAAMMELASGSHGIAQPTDFPHSAVAQTDTEYVLSDAHTSVSVEQCTSEGDSHAQEVQEQYEVVTCAGVEQDIPTLPVGAVQVSEMNLALSDHTGHSSQAQHGKDASIDHSSGAVGDEIQHQVEFQDSITPQHSKEHNVIYYSEGTEGIGGTSVVTGPHSVIEAGSAELTADVSVGTEEQELIEFQENQQQQHEQGGISTMFVVTSAGIQPITRHNP